MELVWFKASAPGSLMLMGEHAVLRDHLGLVCAIDQHLSVTIIPRSDRMVHIQSGLGDFTFELKNWPEDTPPVFHFVLNALQYFRSEYTQGFECRIESQFAHDLGFGSSAAVVVAALGAVNLWLHKSSMRQDLLLIQAREIIRKIQGLGSGADVAASVHGGVLAYRANPLQVERLAQALSLVVVYSGYKKKTVEVIQALELRHARHPNRIQKILELMEEGVQEARDAILKNNWTYVGEEMNIQQGLMNALGVSNQDLEAIVETLRKNPGVLGAKISGSGLGDCVIGLGTWEEGEVNLEFELPKRRIPVSISSTGIRYASSNHA